MGLAWIGEGAEKGRGTCGMISPPMTERNFPTEVPPYFITFTGPVPFLRRVGPVRSIGYRGRGVRLGSSWSLAGNADGAGRVKHEFCCVLLSWGQPRARGVGCPPDLKFGVLPRSSPRVVKARFFRLKATSASCTNNDDEVDRGSDQPPSSRPRTLSPRHAPRRLPPGHPRIQSC